MNLQPVILNKYGEMTKSNRKIADYVLANWESIAFSTLDEVAGQIGVSTTTVIRFARMLGVNGYTEFQHELQTSLKNKVSLPRRLDISMEHTNKAKLLTDSFHNDIANLTKTLENLPVEQLASAVDRLIRARRVYIMGMRACFSIAHYMAVRLGQVKENVRLIQGIGGIYPEEVISAGPEDVCVSFMFPRYSRSAMNLLAWFRQVGSQMITIAGPSHASLDEFSDIVLPCWTQGATIKNSLVAPMCLSQYLVAEVMLRDSENAKAVLGKIEGALSQSGSFVLE